MIFFSKDEATYLTEREKWEEKEGTKVGIVFQKITQVRATSQVAFKKAALFETLALYLCLNTVQ